MSRAKKSLSVFLAALFTILTMLQGIPAQAASKAITVPNVAFASAPVTEYIVGDRVSFNIFSPNYGGRVEYRVVLWNDARKTYYDLWNPSNGYPTCYYSKWQPYGNNIFTLGWVINEPGSYRITVYAKRAGIPSSKTAMKGYNCDSFMESVAFRVKAKNEILSFMPIPDITINQGSVPVLPKTVTAVMTDGTQKVMNVSWGLVDTTKLGNFVIDGTVEGTYKKASVKLIINQGTFSVDNIYSVQAKDSSEVDVNLINKIEFIPATARFTVSDSYGTSVKIYTLVMSSDKRTIQISTDYMIPGRTYTFTVDGRKYNFTVPGSTSSNVTITADDIQVGVGKTVNSDVTVSARDVTLYFESANENVAEVDENTGRIYGVKSGATTIYVYAKRSGTTVGYATFSVMVGGSSSYQTPDEDNSNVYSDDNGDGTATISVEVMDTRDDPIENLEASDFVIIMNRKDYGIGSRYPFKDFDEIGDGVYEFSFEPDEDDEDFPVEEEIDIMVLDEYVCRDLDVEVTKEDDTTSPEADELIVKISKSGTTKPSTVKLDYDEGYETIDAKVKDKLTSMTIEVSDDFLDTSNVKVYITKPGGTKKSLGYFVYDKDDEIWKLDLSSSYVLSDKGTYTIEATFTDKSDNELPVEISIEVE